MDGGTKGSGIVEPKTTTTTTKPVTTTTTTTSATTSKTTTEEVTVTTTTTTGPIAHPSYEFDKVISYPTKTSYKDGESLDIDGIKFTGKLSGSVSSNIKEMEYTSLQAGYGADAAKITITDKTGKTYSNSEFKTLPEGEYTVNIKGDVGNYYSSNLCKNVDISYKVTIGDTSSGVWGDANSDGTVDMSDVVLIMQSLANPNKYGVNGTDKNHITAAGLKYGSVVNNNGSVTNGDALEIQLFLLGKRTDLIPKA